MNRNAAEAKMISPVYFPNVKLEVQIERKYDCFNQAIVNLFSSFPSINLTLEYIENAVRKAKISDLNQAKDIKFIKTILRSFLAKKEMAISISSSFPHGNSQYPDWPTVISKTPSDSHLLLILGTCQSNSLINHFIGVNLLTNVAFDSSIPCVAFKFNIRSIAQLVLKTPLAVASITFVGGKHLQTMLFPMMSNNE